MHWTIYESPFGPLALIGRADALRHLYFPRRAPAQHEAYRAQDQFAAATPYGTTTTYGALANKLGAARPGGPPEPQAVAAAIARTPIPIIIPCHRVISADGSLTGYLGGLRRKQALLDFEASGGDPTALDAAWHQRQLALL
jgi:methylated-DNA-[protein]-cysteine S-methyltransferase